MIVPMSKRFLKRSFEKTVYTFQDKPEPVVKGEFGIYVHVPFCKSSCTFCPFYKEIYNFHDCTRYLEAVVSEIGSSPISGKASWVYFGGGTPNMLTVEQLARIKDAITSKVDVRSVGVELLPDALTPEYIRDLRIAKFTKVSLGVESLNPGVLGGTGRQSPGKEGIAGILKEVKYRGLWSNLDFMIGLPGQKGPAFLADIKTASEFDPSQITIYPFMQLGRMKAEPSMSDKDQYMLIEEAWKILAKAGYSRSGIWTFSKGDDVYDSSRDELVEDYFGFGPAAFSTYGQWKAVNPEVAVYLADWKAGRKRALVAPKTEESDQWRLFARKLYDLDFSDLGGMGPNQNKVIGILKKTGYLDKQYKLTEKGIMYAHDITKTVVESLPYPLQNPDKVGNWAEYETIRNQAKGL